jgi:hypothetical protein
MSFTAVAMIFYHFVLREQMLRWGTPERIREMTLPGDSLCTAPKYTRAVFIQATPDKVWPWLRQLGQERAGFYSYSFLENVALADMHNVYELMPEFQAPREAGDTIWLASPKRYPGLGYQIFAMVDDERSLVMVSGENFERLVKGYTVTDSWAFYLVPENGGTWLIARSSYDAGLGRYLFYEIPHFIMERKMLASIQELAEEK